MVRRVCASLWSRYLTVQIAAGVEVKVFSILLANKEVLKLLLNVLSLALQRVDALVGRRGGIAAVEVRRGNVRRRLEAGEVRGRVHALAGLTVAGGGAADHVAAVSRTGLLMVVVASSSSSQLRIAPWLEKQRAFTRGDIEDGRHRSRVAVVVVLADAVHLFRIVLVIVVMVIRGGRLRNDVRLWEGKRK